MKTLVATIVATLACAAIGHAQPPPPGPPGAPPRDNRQPPAQTGSAMVRGRVVAADTGRPLRRARVTMFAPELGRDGRSTSTDLDGTYEITDLPPGRFVIRVVRSGYLTLQYGQRRPLEQGKPLQVADKQVVEHVDFTLPRTSVIRGQIDDELNEPIAGVNVLAMRIAYWQGRRRLVPAGAAAQTDEGGEYRLTNLSPGTYFVMAHLRDTWTVRGNGVAQAMGYAPTYFPGTASVAEARRVTIGVGQVAAATDFSLIPGRAVNVSGTAVDSTGSPLTYRSVMVVQPLVGPGAGMMMPGGSATTDADGSFTIANVPPGHWKLQAQTTRQTQTVQGTVLEVGSLPLTIDGTDATNLALRTTMGWMASGRVTTENGGLPDAPRERFGIIARLVDTDQSPFGGAPPPPPPPGGSGVIVDSGRMKEDWTFAVTPIFGPARLRVSLPDGWSVTSILQDGRDIADAVVDMKSGEELTDVHVIVTNRVTSVGGQVIDAKGAASTDATVIVFVDDPEKWAEDSRWVRAVRTDAQGRWEVKGLPPGEYRAIALDYAEDGIWNDAEYLGSIRQDAGKLTLRGTDRVTLSLTIAKLP